MNRYFKMTDFTFKAQSREALGTGASRRLRKEDKLPIIVYGGDKEPLSLTLTHDDLFHASEKDGFFDSILKIKIGRSTENVKIKALQRHPYKLKLVHADFLRV